MWPLWAQVSGEVCRKDCAQSERERVSEGGKWAGLQRRGKRRKAGRPETALFQTFTLFISVVFLVRSERTLCCSFCCCFVLLLFFCVGGVVARKFHFFCVWVQWMWESGRRFFFFFFFFLKKHRAGGMYPTRAAAAGQRPWRCPGCALWIALLLQSVLDLSASGESLHPLIVPLSLSLSPPSAGPASLCGSDLSWKLFVGTFTHVPSSGSGFTAAVKSPSVMDFLPGTRTLSPRVNLIDVHRLLSLSPPPPPLSPLTRKWSLVFRLSSHCQCGASARGKTWLLLADNGGLLTSQLDSYCAPPLLIVLLQPNPPFQSWGELKDKTCIKSQFKQFVEVLGLCDGQRGGCKRRQHCGDAGQAVASRKTILLILT